MEFHTYDELIQHVLDTRGRFACGDEYHERHHIIPKSIGGSGKKSNLIDLYAHEHFIAHKLLAEENPDDLSLTRAYAIMAFGVSNDRHHRYECTPEEYEQARITFAKSLSEYYSNPENHPCYGRTASAETRAKQSAIAKKRCADPTKNPMYGKRGPDNPRFGKKVTGEALEHIRAGAAKRKPQDISGAKNPRAKRVIRLSDGKVYGCMKELAVELGRCKGAVRKLIECGTEYMYYNDYIEMI